jgi:RNA polymerase sigma-70 factor (ECF subfamily)
VLPCRRQWYFGAWIFDNRKRTVEVGRMSTDHAAPAGPGRSYAAALVNGEARVLDPAGLGDHVDRLYRAAWALCGSREDAEDLVQDTFARVLAKPRLLRNDDDLGYLLRVLRNTFVSRHRAASRRPVTTPMPEQFEPVDHNAGTRPEEAVDARQVFACISALPEAFRDALVAVDVVGLSYAEAARALGTREATITSRLYRARAQVARGMEPHRPGVL